MLLRKVLKRPFLNLVVANKFSGDDHHHSHEVHLDKNATWVTFAQNKRTACVYGHQQNYGAQVQQTGLHKGHSASGQD